MKYECTWSQPYELAAWLDKCVANKIPTMLHVEQPATMGDEIVLKNVWLRLQRFATEPEVAAMLAVFPEAINYNWPVYVVTPVDNWQPSMEAAMELTEEKLWTNELPV